MSTGEQDDWTQYLAWDKDEGHRLHLVLEESRGFDPREQLLGYACVDQETYLALVEVTIHGIGQMFQNDVERPLWLRLCLVVDEDSHELEWRLQAVSLRHPHESLGDRFKLTQSLQELQDMSKNASNKDQAQSQSDPAGDGEIDIDDYWGRYSDDAPENASEQGSEADSEDYYGRYNSQVETAIQTSELPMNDSDQTKTSRESSYPSLLPDIVHHAESSIRSMRTLCHAAALSDEQIREIFNKVMDETK